jgi:hypothetical protein
MSLSDYKQSFSKVYAGIVIAGAIVGACKGVGKWYDWYSTRKYRSIKYKNLEPVINITCDVGKLAYNVTAAGLLSGMVTATAPVSVPILLYTCEETPVKGIETVQLDTKLDY